MITSPSIVKISGALLKAQKSIKSVTKDASNPFFKSKYADLASVINACKEELNAEGITFLQPVDGMNVETLLLHESGEYISAQTPIVCKSQNNPQDLGSAITYARRYGLQSMIGLPAIDDDGEGATSHSDTPRTVVTPENDVMAVYQVKKTICEHCGGDMVVNPKTGMKFCENKCWLNK